MPARVRALKSVDLPTFGKPTIPHLRRMRWKMKKMTLYVVRLQYDGCVGGGRRHCRQNGGVGACAHWIARCLAGARASPPPCECRGMRWPRVCRERRYAKAA